MAITESYIMQLVRNYARSPEGKRAIKEQLGIEFDDDFDAGKARMYGERMKSILFKHVNAQIRSITMEDIIVEAPIVHPNGGVELKVSFREEALQRESLSPEGYPDGLNNIILLFAKGYETSSPIRGNWNYNGALVAENIWGKRSRAPSNFLQEAVSEFNALTTGVAIAYLEGEYA